MEKIKLVIVDDELTSRNTIKKYLDGNSMYEIVADFQNGKSALEWLRSNSVDILLCDMQMPEINGVELMRNVHIIDEYLPIIAISGFDDFNFVRGSLINGAANYLLKHELSQEYLIRVLDQVREQYRIVPKGDMVYQKKGFCIYDKSLFQADYIRELVEESRIDFCCSNVCCLTVGPDYKINEDMNVLGYKQDISKAVMDILSQILGDNYPYLIYITKEYHLVILISFKSEKSMLFMMNTISNLAGRMQRLSMRMLDITLSIACGEVHSKIEGAIQEAESLQQLLDDKFYLGANRIVYGTVTKPVSYSNQELPDKYWEQLEFELKSQIPGCADTVNEILDQMEKMQVKRRYALQSCERILQLLGTYGYLEAEKQSRLLELIKEFEEFAQCRWMISDILLRKMQTMNREEKKQYSQNITQVLQYIKKNYASDISLETCAELVGCSYTSLSKEFKKETGMRFVEYLNQQRVNKAKSLLIRQDMSMKEIVELSGFRNYNYFFKVFKELVGVTPSEFVTKK